MKLRTFARHKALTSDWSIVYLDDEALDALIEDLGALISLANEELENPPSFVEEFYGEIQRIQKKIKDQVGGRK